MVDSDLANEENAIDVSAAEKHARVQCAEIRLISSVLQPLDPDKEKESQSRFTFRIQVDVQGRMAYSQLHTQVVWVSSEAGEPLRGYWLRFVLAGVFAGDESSTPEVLADFARLYTLSLLWPYAREYTSDQFRRAGEPFDSLPIINPQVLTESMIDVGLVEVVIHTEDPGTDAD